MSEKIYSEKDIIVLKEHEAIRKCPGMYIGSVDQKGFILCLKNIFTNAFLQLKPNHITIHFLEQQKVKLAFHNLQNPVYDSYANRFPNVSFFADMETKIMNALSKHFTFRLYDNHDQLIHKKTYQYGVLTEGQEENKYYEAHKMIFEFELDQIIWEDFDWHIEYMLRELREFATLYAHAKFEIHYEVEREACKAIFQYKNGLKDRLDIEKLNLRGSTYFDTYFEKMFDHFSMQVAFAFRRYSVDFPFIKSYVNDYHTIENGSHVSALYKGLTYGLMQYFQKNNLTHAYRISQQGIEEEILAIVHIKIENPNFTGCVKNTLDNPEIIAPISDYVKEIFFEKIQNNEKATQELIRKFEVPTF